MLMFELRTPLYENEESTTSVGADIAELEGEPEVQAPPKEEEDEVEPELEDEEAPEVEEETEEESAKDLHPFDRPSIQQINEAFPEFFKKFPSMKDVYFRENQYSKIFPTIDEAKEAVENATAFQTAREDIFTGDGAKFLTAIKDTDEKALVKFSANVLPSLFKVHPAAFWRAANPLVEDIAKNMFQKGIKEKNESMQNAARYLSDYFFGDTEIAEGKKTTVVKEADTSEVNKEREAFDNEKQTAFSNTVQVDAKTQLIKFIDSKDQKGKSRLDPDEVLTPFIKGVIIDRILSEVGEQLQADKDHIRFMDSLWSRAKRNGRTEEDKTRIISAYLARAKSLIPSLRSKYVSEALGRASRASTQRRERVSNVQEYREGPGRPTREGSKGYNPKSINYDKTSDLDLLNDNVTYK